MPPRKSIDELKANGTYRPSRHGSRLQQPDADSEAVPPDPLPVPPEIDGPAAVWWERLAAALAGRIQPSDAPLLARACQWAAQEDSCREAIEGLCPTTPEHARGLRGAAAAASACNAILRGFGLSPESRMRLPGGSASASSAPAPKPAKTHTRPKTTYDLAAEAWLAAGHTGQPAREFVDRFRQQHAK